MMNHNSLDDILIPGDVFVISDEMDKDDAKVFLINYDEQAPAHYVLQELTGEGDKTYVLTSEVGGRYHKRVLRLGNYGDSKSGVEFLKQNSGFLKDAGRQRLKVNLLELETPQLYTTQEFEGIGNVQYDSNSDQIRIRLVGKKESKFKEDHGEKVLIHYYLLNNTLQELLIIINHLKWNRLFCFLLVTIHIFVFPKLLAMNY